MLTAEQNVAAVFVVALFYGLYLATFFHCIRWICFTDEGWILRDRRKIQWPMLLVTIAIFILSTINRAFELQTSMVQAGKYNQQAPPSSNDSDKDLSWVAVLLCTDANLTTLIADAVLIYRCWAFYEKSIGVIVFPLFLWVGGLALTGLQAYVQIVKSAKITHAWLPVNMVVGPGIILTPFWATTIALNLYATFMITYRLYRISKRVTFNRSMRLIRFVTKVIVESGFLYLTTGIAHFVVWWTPNNFAITIVSWINIPVIGIAFNLILIRQAQNRAHGDSDSNATDFFADLKFASAEAKSTAIDPSSAETIAVRSPSRLSQEPSISAV